MTEDSPALLVGTRWWVGLRALAGGYSSPSSTWRLSASQYLRWHRTRVRPGSGVLGGQQLRPYSRADDHPVGLHGRAIRAPTLVHFHSGHDHRG